MAMADIGEAARIRARGALVSLAGAEFRLRFDWDALERLEAEFGNISAFERAKNAATRGQGPILRVIRMALTVGMEPAMPTEILRETLDQERRDGNLGPLVRAVHEAWLEAWPAADDGNNSGKGEGEKRDSPSPITSSSRPSTSTARKRSSGR